MKDGRIRKKLVEWCIGKWEGMLKYEVKFGNEGYCEK
jgi:broad specificity phosphatase PhoE